MVAAARLGAQSACANYHEPPKPLEVEEIRELIEYFARSARNAAAGGFDGIEIHGGHGYLIHEFLSPRSNRRTDAYGGSLENRMRFAVEVLEAVREAVGGRLTVGLRLVGDEELGPRRGLGAEDAAEIGARFEALGLVDFLNVSIGLSGLGMVRPAVQPARARRLRGACGEAGRPRRAGLRGAPHPHAGRGRGDPRARRGRRHHPGTRADRRRGLGREGSRAGARTRSARCTGCNQGCYGNLLQSLPVACATNPAVGREDTLGRGSWVPAATPRSASSWSAAGRPGWKPPGWRRRADTGCGCSSASACWAGRSGSRPACPGAPSSPTSRTGARPSARAAASSIELGVEASADGVLALAPDAVIVATGGRATVQGLAKWWSMPVPGWSRTSSSTTSAAQREQASLGPRVVVFDVVGHIEGPGLAELLASRGLEVTLVSPLAQPMLLDPETLVHALARACRAGARWRPTTGLAAIGEREVMLVNLLSGKTERVERVDQVVIRTHGLPEDALYHALRGRTEVIRVGDAVAVRNVDRAVFDGHQAGRRL